MPTVNENGEYTDSDLKIQKFEFSQVSKDSSEILSPLSQGSNLKDHRMESKIFEVNKYQPPDDDVGDQAADPTHDGLRPVRVRRAFRQSP